MKHLVADVSNITWLKSDRKRGLTLDPERKSSWSRGSQKDLERVWISRVRLERDAYPSLRTFLRSRIGGTRLSSCASAFYASWPPPAMVWKAFRSPRWSRLKKPLARNSGFLKTLTVCGNDRTKNRSCDSCKRNKSCSPKCWWKDFSIPKEYWNLSWTCIRSSESFFHFSPPTWAILKTWLNSSKFNVIVVGVKGCRLFIGSRYFQVI